MTCRARLLIVGWDGATWDVIRPLFDRRQLPHLHRLVVEGAHGSLESTVPPSSAVAWPTFATGRQPAGHGIFGFYATEPGSRWPRLISSRDVQAPSLWDWLGGAGCRVAVVNIPVTFPPRPVNGLLVSGMLTPGPEDVYTYPPELGVELQALPRPYPIEAPLVKELRAERSPAGRLDILRRLTDDFHGAVRRLLAREDWDLFVVVYRASDLVQHKFWPPGLAGDEAGPGLEIAAVHQQLDACLGDLLSLVPADTTVMVVSDHGFGPSSASFHVNDWLRQQGYLVLGRPAWWPSTRRLPLRRVLVRLGLAAVAGRLPRGWADRLVPLPTRHPRYWQARIDWCRTRVYVPQGADQSLALRLNLAGREPAGIVRPGAEAEALLAELAGRVAALRDPAGGLLLHPPEIPAPGANLAASRQPDLLARVCEDGQYVVVGRLNPTGEVLVRSPVRGQHRQHGIFVAHGPAIGPGVTLPGARLVDVAPTALHLAGQPVPAAMDGQVLQAALRPDWAAAHPVARLSAASDAVQTGPPPADEYTPEERARVEDALRALGYLD